MNLNTMLPENTYAGKTVWITGGGTGLGKGMATQFLKLGAHVIITGRREEVLEKTHQEWKDAGLPHSSFASLDVRDSVGIETFLDHLTEKNQLPDVLINNAAGNFISRTEDLSPKAFEVVVDIVLKGTANCSLLLGQRWIKTQKQGAILNITTTYADTGSGFVVPSACAKAGVSNLTKSLASEWGKYGIRCNAVAPGPIPTKGAWDRLMPAGLDKMFDLKGKNPLKRYGEPEELANLVSYICSDYAAFMNGSVVTFDGGEKVLNGGEFNFLEQVQPEQWQQLAQFMREQRKKKG